MTPALVFTHSGAAATACGGGRLAVRDDILYRNAEAALAIAGARDTRADGVQPLPATRPGALRLGTDEQVLAVGLGAHIALADCRKSTLLAETFDLEAFGETGRPDDEAINGLLWSCLNTRRAVAVGRRAWSAAQLLPFSDLRFHAVPPLRWIAAADALDRDRILLVDHETAGTAAVELQAALSSYARVEILRGWTIGGQRPAEMADLDAGIHLHLGDHTLADDAPRLVDSWINRVPVLQVRPRRTATPPVRDEEVLRVRHAQNGFECAGIGDVLAAYEDLRNDRVLRAKMTEAGARTVAPLAEGWRAIAADLLDG